MEWKGKYMTKLRNNNKGFSLIELIAAIAISVFIVGAAYSFVIVGTNNYENTSKSTTLQQEVTFAGNLIGEAARSGIKEETAIRKYSTGDEMLYLGDGKKVFYYSAANKSLYVYSAVSGQAIDSSVYKVNNPDNLVSKYVTSFDVIYVSQDGGAVPSEADYISGTNVTGNSSLIKVSMAFAVRGKSDTSEVVYEIRN